MRERIKGNRSADIGKASTVTKRINLHDDIIGYKTGAFDFLQQI